MSGVQKPNRRYFYLFLLPLRKHTMVVVLVLESLTFSYSMVLSIDGMNIQSSSKYFSDELSLNYGMKSFQEVGSYIEGLELTSTKLICAGHSHVQTNTEVDSNQMER